MKAIFNSWWMYLLGIFVFLFVLFTSFAFIYKSYRRAKAIGLEKGVIKKTVITSIVFSLLPSISILIGVITLSGSLGVPFPWIRLSVIGALHYEMTSYGVAANQLNLTNNLITNEKEFITIATVMTLFILSGPIFCFFGFKKYDQKLISKAKAKEGEEVVNDAKPKKSFGPFLFSAAFIALVSSFLAEGIAKIKDVGKLGETIEGSTEVYGPLETYTPLVVIIVSFTSMALFDLIAKKAKAKWLNDFALGFSMILGMGSAVVIELIAK